MDMTLESLLNSWWDYQKRNIFTAIPARIVGVRDLEQGRIDVQPLTNMVFADYEDTIEWPTILSVPVMWPSSSTSAVTFPLYQGDTVLLVFCQKSLDVFKGGDGTPQPPNDYRMFDKRDAVAIPGLWPFGMNKNKKTNRSLPHSTSDVVVSHNLGTDNECEVRLKQTGEVAITSPLKVSVTAPITQVVSTTSATVTAPIIATNSTGTTTVTALNANVIATALASITAPAITMTGNVAVTGTTFTFNGLNVQTA